jgi:hypothetical protein
MQLARCALLWLTLASACGDGGPPLLGAPDEGEVVSLTVGSSASVKLRTIGAGSYAEPELSNDMVEFEGSKFVKPFLPSGPTQLFHFRCKAEGSCDVLIPHVDGVDDEEQSFSLTFQCEPKK